MQAVFLWEYFKASYFWMCFLCRHLAQNLFIFVKFVTKITSNCLQDVSGISYFYDKAETHSTTHFFKSQSIILPNQAGYQECCSNSSAWLSKIIIWLANCSGLASFETREKNENKTKVKKAWMKSCLLFSCLKAQSESEFA